MGNQHTRTVCHSPGLPYLAVHAIVETGAVGLGVSFYPGKLLFFPSGLEVVPDNRFVARLTRCETKQGKSAKNRGYIR